MEAYINVVKYQLQPAVGCVTTDFAVGARQLLRELDGQPATPTGTAPEQVPLLRSELFKRRQIVRASEKPVVSAA